MQLTSIATRYPASFFYDQLNQELATFPQDFSENLENLDFIVEDWAPEELELQPGVLGLFSGIPLPKRSIFHTYEMPDIIYLFRMPILRHHMATGKAVQDIIRHVVVHEVAHYFGFSDADLLAQGLY